MMNKTIKDLNKKLESNQVNESEIEEKLQLAWNKIFQKLPQLVRAVSQLELSNDYSWDKYGEIVQWIRFDLSDFEYCRQYLKEYMRESHYVEIDWENDSLSLSIGTAIVINDDGDVYDQDGDKFFIKKSDYRDEDTGELDEDKRNKLIEEYMEKTGCYPGVYRSDRHGNVFPVKTTGEKHV